MTDLRKAVIGFGWLGVLKVFTKGLTVLKIIIVARILSPQDLGSFGLAAVLLSLAEVMTETGINTFLIQSRHAISKHLDTAWVVSILRGALIGAVIASLSYLLARIFNEPSLTILLVYISLIPFIRGFINPSVIRFHKEMTYHKHVGFRSVVFFIEVIATLGFVFALRSPLALILGMIVSAVTEVLLSQLFILPKPRFRIDRIHLREILNYGKWLNLAGLLSFLSNNADDLILGKVLGTAPLGYYQTAFNVTQSATGEFGELASQAFFPAYSRARKNVQEMKRVLFRAFPPLLVITIIPAVIILAFPSQIISLVLSPKWLPIIPVLPWLFGAAILQALNGIMYPIYLAVEKPKYNTVVVFWNLLVMLVTIVPLIRAYDLVGVGMSVFIARLSAQPLYLFYLKKILWQKT